MSKEIKEGQKAFNKLFDNMAVTRGDDWKSLSECQRLRLSSEASALTEASAQNMILLSELDKTTKDMEDKALSVIDAMGLVFDQKNESIEKLRSWRKTIESETRQATSAIKELDKLLATDRLEGLSVLVELIEKLNEVKTTDIINKLLK